MNNLLSRLLEKRGIKKTEELSDSERGKYETWMRIFEKEIKIEDLTKFITAEVLKLEDEWLNDDNKNPFAYLFEWKKNIEMKARIKNYKNIISFISEPQRNKENLEKYLKKLINN